MKEERKYYSRYHIVRGHETLWRGDPSEAGSQFRQVLITSDEFNWTVGTFQVYALEGIGKGIQDGKFSGTEEGTKLLFDQEFQGLDTAGKKFEQIVNESVAAGFKSFTFVDDMMLQAKLNRKKQGY
jgi:hypothetical protein